MRKLGIDIAKGNNQITKIKDKYLHTKCVPICLEPQDPQYYKKWLELHLHPE